MSPNNIHMVQKSAGIRGGIAKFTTNEPPFSRVNELYKRLHEQMEHIHTWEAFNLGCKAWDLYGNTKHTDLAIIPHFFNSGLNMTVASEAIGYVPRVHNANGCMLPPTGLMFRLRRMNIYNLFAVIKVFVDKGLIDIETIREILRINGKFTQKHATIRRGKFYRYYAKWYVTSGIEYFKETDVDIVKKNTEFYTIRLATELGLPITTIRYWRGLEVENIMVKPTY